MQPTSDEKPTEFKGSEAEAVSQMEMAIAHLSTVVPTRENSLALTKLQEAVMWCIEDQYRKHLIANKPYPYSPNKDNSGSAK